MSLLEQAIESSPKLDSTKQQYLMAVRDFLSFAGYDPSTWTTLSVERWCLALADRGLKPKTIVTYLAAVRYASRRFHRLHNGVDFAYAVEMPRLDPQEDPEVQPLTTEECRALVAACEDARGRLDPRGLRDRAIILLALHTALRRGELTSLTLDKVRGNKEEGTVTVLTKGRRWNTIEVAGEGWEALLKWRAWLWSQNIRQGPIFRALRERIDGWQVQGGLSSSGLYKALLRRAELAGVEDFHPHRFRHTFVTMAREAGWADWQIRQVTGHRSADLTDHYSHHRGGPLGATFPKLGD